MEKVYLVEFTYSFFGERVKEMFLVYAPDFRVACKTIEEDEDFPQARDFKNKTIFV